MTGTARIPPSSEPVPVFPPEPFISYAHVWTALRLQGGLNKCWT